MSQRIKCDRNSINAVLKLKATRAALEKVRCSENVCLFSVCDHCVLPRRNDTNRGGINKYLCTKEGVDWFGALRTARPHLGD